MAWQSIISSHPTTDPRSRLFRCGSIILLVDNLKVGSGAVSVVRVRDGRSPHTHLFLRSNKQDDCGTVLHRASLLSSHLHRESLPSGSKRAQRHGGSEGRIRRLMICVPPRHLKSHLGSVSFPAWCLGHDPSAQILCVSYAQDLADKLSRDCRRIVT